MNQLSIGMTGMNRQGIAMFDRAHNGTQLRKIKLRIDALRIKIQRQRDEIDIAGALAIAEQATFNTVCTSEQGLFRRGNRRSRSLCGCTLIITLSRRERLRQNHSIWSA